MKAFWVALAVAILGAIWAREWFVTQQLRNEIAATATDRVALDSLHRRNAELKAKIAAETAAVQREHRDSAGTAPSAERARAEREDDPNALPLQTGAWWPVSRWQNRGTGTPRAAVETALWAASGGDTAGLLRTLEVSEAVRAQAEALLGSLRAQGVTTYATAEDLIAAFTTRNIPLGAAQVVWSNEPDADHADLAVFLKNPVPAERPVPEETTPGDRPPPMLLANTQVKVTYLSLHRVPDGWRLVVPPSALDKIRGELTAAAAR